MQDVPLTSVTFLSLHQLDLIHLLEFVELVVVVEDAAPVQRDPLLPQPLLEQGRVLLEHQAQHLEGEEPAAQHREVGQLVEHHAEVLEEVVGEVVFKRAIELLLGGAQPGVLADGGLTLVELLLDQSLLCLILPQLLLCQHPKSSRKLAPPEIDGRIVPPCESTLAGAAAVSFPGLRLKHLAR